MGYHWVKEKIEFALIDAETYKDVLSNLGLKSTSNNNNRLKFYISEFGLKFETTKFKIKDKWKRENLTEIIKNSKNRNDIITKLGLSHNGNNLGTLNKYIKLYDIDITHFEYIPHGRNKYTKQDINEILVVNSKYKSTNNLKHRLYNEGLKERVCEKCGQGEEWNGEKMSLILDHINGINNDNRLENLQIVCPNCNATLPTHCGKNKPREKKKYYCDCGKEKSSRFKEYCDDCSYIKGSYYNKQTNNTNFCKCGEKISSKANQCEKCYRLSSRKIERPPYDKLIKEIKETSYVAVGRKYGVSDTAIRKWKNNYEKLKL